MMRISLSKAWDDTKEVVAQESRLLVAVAMALLVLPQTLLGAFTPTSPADVNVGVVILLLVVLVTAVAGQIAISRLAIPPSSSVGESLRRGLTRTPIVVLSLILFFFLLVVICTLIALPFVASGVIGAPVSGQPPSGGLAMIFLLAFLSSFAVVQLVIPISSVEQGGPLRLIARAWTIARVNYWKFLAFAVLAIVGMLLIWLTTQIIVGAAVAAIFGPPDRGSFPLVMSAFLVSIAQAGWTVVMAVMLARLYFQASGGDVAVADAGVPNSGT